MKYICPLCGKEDCYDSSKNAKELFCFNCDLYDRELLVGSSIINCKVENHWNVNSLLLEYVLKHSKENISQSVFFYEPTYIRNDDESNYINIAELHYPKSFSEKVDRVLLNIYRVYSEFSDYFDKSKISGSMVFSESYIEDEKLGLLDILVDLGYLDGDQLTKNYIITAKGWKRIEFLTQNEKDIDQCFVAMSFSDETKEIYEYIKIACNESGYTSLRIDEKEHNNQIVPEIFYEIKRSKFVILDISVPNFGAYYEAGYALGVGKEVIICCRKDAFISDDKDIRPHFDVQQKSAIIWEDKEDLIKRLKKRIEATIS